MGITFFGIIWFSFLLICIIIKDRRWMFVFTSFSMLFQSNNVLIIGESEIGPQIIAVSFAFINFLFFRDIANKHNTPKGLKISFVFLLSVVLISSLINTYSSITKLMMIVIYFLFTLLLTNKSLFDDIKKLEKLENALIIFVLIVGILQMVAVAGILPIKPVMRVLFFNDIYNEDVIFNYKTNVAFYSTFMEPSYCAVFLIGAFFLVISRNNFSFTNIILSFSILLAIILSKSTTAYISLLLCLAIFSFTKSQNKSNLIIIFTLIVSILVMYYLFYSVLDSVLFSKTESGSYKVRSLWNERALANFYSNPVLGVGYGNSRASSLIYTILGELGLFGIIAYISMFLYFLKQLLIKKQLSYVQGHAFGVIGAIVCQVIACPDLNLSSFWLMVFLYIAAYNIKNSKIQQYENRNTYISSST